MLVLVGTTVPVSGSLVLGVLLGPLTRVKFEPVTVPCVCTDAAPGGVFTVASYLMVTLLPTFNTTGRLNETVSPLRGVILLSLLAGELTISDSCFFAFDLIAWLDSNRCSRPWLDLASACLSMTVGSAAAGAEFMKSAASGFVSSVLVLLAAALAGSRRSPTVSSPYIMSLRFSTSYISVRPRRWPISSITPLST